jgi:3' exoribonuclease, RNase T-like
VRLFLDTEFTDFVNPELISIGIVDESGREFYAERNDFPREACSEFVVETVLPLLGQSDGIVGTQQHIASQLERWLEEYRESGAIICVDYHTDWHLFQGLLSELPKRGNFEFITHDNIWSNLDSRSITQWWSDTQLPQHHALYDAYANRHGYIGQTEA